MSADASGPSSFLLEAVTVGAGSEENCGTVDLGIVWARCETGGSVGGEATWVGAKRSGAPRSSEADT